MSKGENRDEVISRLERIEGLLVALISINTVQEKGLSMSREDARRVFGAMTPKQHAVAQMMLAGVVDREMGERMGITRNTVKLHRSAIANKLNAADTNESIQRLRAAFDAIDSVEYQRLSGGLPKDWAASWRQPDPYRDIYVKH